LATGKAPSPLGLALHFWTAVVGSFIYVISLSVGGTIQGLDWIHGAPFIQSVADMQSYWVWRGVGGLLMLLSHVVFAWNVWIMTRVVVVRTEGVPAGATASGAAA
jgi:cytochrome c oxidase cbb3-type subunit I